MDIIQSSAVHRKGKKWKSRWAVFRATSSVPDSIGTTLMIYKDSNHANIKQHKNILPLWKYAGCAVFNEVESKQNVLMIFTEAKTIALSFQNQSLLSEWQAALQHHFGQETTFPVDIPIKQKLKAGESTLYVCNDFFAIINNKSYRCVGRWKCSELSRYATIENDFVFEVDRNRNGKSQTYRLQTKNSAEIVEIFDCINETQNSEMKNRLKDQLNSGSSVLLELEQGRRNTVGTDDQNVFQRAFLRVSNRFRKHKRERAATVGSRKQTRRERLKEMELKQASSKENSSMPDITDGRSIGEKNTEPIDQLPSDFESQSCSVTHKPRSSSHGNFSSESSKNQTRAKYAWKQNSSVSVTTSSGQTVVTKTTSPIKWPSSSCPTTRTLKSSVGSASAMSVESRGVSMCSDVFDEDINENRDTRSSKANGPPVAPPRSPISLGIFEFPSEVDNAKSTDSVEREYLNKQDLDKLKMRGSTSEHEGSNVTMRTKTGESSLLEEIDREIKRRTRDNESDENNTASALSTEVPYQFEDDALDNEDSGEAYVLLRTTDTGPNLSIVQSESKTESHVNRKESCTSPSGIVDQSTRSDSARNNDPGVSSPNAAERESPQVDYQNVSDLVNENGVDVGPPRGRRNSSRRASSKHLSDPVAIERFAAAQQQFQDHIVSGSLREIHQEMNYVNVKGKEEKANDAATYVNMAGASERKLRKGKKPQPLNLNRSQIHWDKYDDDDKIYHDVGPLMTNGKSGSTDGLNDYKNIGVGSYENISGRTTRDRAYVNVPSPNHKKPGTMLNYVLVSGKSGPKSTPATNRTGSLNSVNSYKSDYSMIDEKATSLLQRTREQHWQRREEDGQAQLSTPRKTKKSQGD